MKLWHDDIRIPPDVEWRWCRTNEQLLANLDMVRTSGRRLTELSLDHDMGLDSLDPRTPDSHLMAGTSREDGTKLVRTLIDPDNRDLMDWIVQCRPRVTVHSMNSFAGLRMVSMLQRAGLRQTKFIPFSVS